MDPVLEFAIKMLETLSGWVRPYLSEIGLSMAATLLVIFGDDMISFVKSQIGSLGYFLRLTLFVLFCAIGFAFITSFLTPVVIGWFAHISNLWLGVSVIASYYLIGFLAQRKGMI
ncbi:MAG: DUF3392 domain-containing protein [Hydrogenovibrio sp.]|nr:DUF3392 domain-containing protein [Hydrogenovibrio sp.]